MNRDAKMFEYKKVLVDGVHWNGHRKSKKALSKEEGHVVTPLIGIYSRSIRKKLSIAKIESSFFEIDVIPELHAIYVCILCLHKPS